MRSHAKEIGAWKEGRLNGTFLSVEKTMEVIRGNLDRYDERLLRDLALRCVRTMQEGISEWTMSHRKKGRKS
jgi:hypothetical protein